MKKRLLSAALALAMVLTMLPLTAFAADPKPSDDGSVTAASDNVTVCEGKTFNYRAKDYTLYGSGDSAVKTPMAGLYYVDTAADGSKTAYSAESGVLNANSVTSGGVWYSTLDNAVTAKKTSIVLLENTSLGSSGTNLTTALFTTLTIDLNGHTLGGTFTIPAKYTNSSSNEVANTFSSLTIKDSKQTGTNWSTTQSDFAVAVGAAGDGNSKTNNTTVTLQNVSTSGEINAYYTTSCTINLKNAKAGDITMMGTSGGTLNLGTSASEKAEASAVSATSTGKTNTTGAKVVAYNAKTTSVALSGIYTSLTGTNSDVGAVTVFGHNGTGIDEKNLGSMTAPSVKLTGGSASGITVATGTEKLTKAYTVTLEGGVTLSGTGAITLANANVTIKNSAVGAIDVDNGSVIIEGAAGNPASATTIALGVTGKTASLEVKGSNVTTTDITAAGGTVNITVPAGLDNTFGTFPASGVANRGIAGGVWGSAVPAANLKDLKYQVARNGGKYVYYAENQFQKLIDEYQDATTKPTISIVGDVLGGSGSNTLTFMNGDEILTVITYKKSSQGITLPTTVNGGAITKWTECKEKTATGGGVSAGDVIRELTGNSYSTPSGSTDPNRVLSTQVTENSITKLENVTTSVAGLKARLEGNVITLSGAIPKGTSEIEITVTTDGKPSIEENVKVVYDNGKVRFANQTLQSGLWVTPDWNYLVMPSDTTRYSLNGSGLKEQADKLDSSWIHGYTDEVPVIVTVSCSGSAWTTIRKEALAAAMTNDTWTNSKTFDKTSSTVNFTQSPAVLEALNAVVAGISDSQVNSWLTAAQNRAWTKAGNTGTPNAEQRALTGYNEVHVVAYMAVNIRNYSTASTPGALTMDLTPSYYVEVRGSSTIPSVYELDPKVSADLNALRPVNNRTLGSLTGEAGKIVLKLKTEATPAFVTAGAWAHQAGTYAYALDNASGKKGIDITITHTVNNGLGNFVIDGSGALVNLYTDKDNTTDTDLLGSYDTLQAAVDDAEENNYIDVDANYKGSCNINVTGKARKFLINTNGANRVTSNVSGTVTEKTSGTLYEVQLERDNITTTTASIGVGTANNGTATVNVSSARAGSTVTITVNPSNGYRSLAPTVRTNSGAAVSVSGSGNTYTFVVPNGATSITVTPSFVQNTGLPFTDVAANAWYFDGVAYCYNNNLMQGYDGAATTFGINHAVTRAEVVTILWRLAGQPIETPRTTYTDVKSGEWHYNAISWATNHGYAKGYGDGRFGPNNPVQRQELAVFLHRYAGEPTVNSNLGAYSDGGGVESWAMAAMRWATSYSILSGTNSVSLNGRLNAYSTAYREQVAVTLQHYHQYYK